MPCGDVEWTARLFWPDGQFSIRVSRPDPRRLNLCCPLSGTLFKRHINNRLNVCCLPFQTWCNVDASLMSASATKRTCGHAQPMSAIGSKADIAPTGCHVCV